MVKFTSTMGVNFSNYFQSNPIHPNAAAKQIRGLPVTSAKIFHHEGSHDFMKAAQANGLTLAVGCTNSRVGRPGRWQYPIIDRHDQAIQGYREPGLRWQ
jgi:hypothetical protein